MFVLESIYSLCTFSRHRPSRSATWYHGGAISNLGRVGNGTIFGTSPLSQVSTMALSPPLSECPTITRCKRSAVVDRLDLETATTLVCPFPRCSYMWCKACQQEIMAGGPPHTCDGSSELDHLMKERGWKYCPSQFFCPLVSFCHVKFSTGCKTPFQKSAGCNHMTVSRHSTS